jgi:hypothetical protein
MHPLLQGSKEKNRGAFNFMWHKERKNEEVILWLLRTDNKEWQCFKDD